MSRDLRNPGCHKSLISLLDNALRHLYLGSWMLGQDPSRKSPRVSARTNNVLAPLLEGVATPIDVLPFALEATTAVRYPRE
jgi:hypothetical protein